MTTLTMPTPEELEAEAVELEKRAGTKERIAAQSWMSQASRDIMLKDAGYFREEAEMKRAKAQRIITREIEAGLRTPSGTLVTTIDAIEAQGLKVWHQHLREIGGMPEEVNAGKKADDDAARLQLETEGAGFAPPDEAFDFQQ